MSSDNAIRILRQTLDHVLDIMIDEENARASLSIRQAQITCSHRYTQIAPGTITCRSCGHIEVFELTAPAPDPKPKSGQIFICSVCGFYCCNKGHAHFDCETEGDYVGLHNSTPACQQVE